MPLPVAVLQTVQEVSEGSTCDVVHGRRVCTDVDDCNTHKAWLVPLPVVVLHACPAGFQAYQIPCPPAHLARPPDPLCR